MTIRNGHGVELGRFEGNLNRFSNAQLVDWDMSEADSLEAIVLMWHMLVNPAVGSDSGAIMITYMGGDTSEVRVNQRNVSKSFLASDWRLSFEDEYLRTDLQTPDTVRLALRTDNSLLLQMDVATEDLPDLRTTQYLTMPSFRLQEFDCTVLWGLLAGAIALTRGSLRTFNANPTTANGNTAATGGLGVVAILHQLNEEGCMNGIKSWLADAIDYVRDATPANCRNGGQFGNGPVCTPTIRVTRTTPAREFVD